MVERWSLTSLLWKCLFPIEHKGAPHVTAGSAAFSPPHGQKREIPSTCESEGFVLQIAASKREDIKTISVSLRCTAPGMMSRCYRGLIMFRATWRVLSYLSSLRCSEAERRNVQSTQQNRSYLANQNPTLLRERFTHWSVNQIADQWNWSSNVLMAWNAHFYVTISAVTQFGRLCLHVHNTPSQSPERWGPGGQGGALKPALNSEKGMWTGNDPPTSLRP